MFTAASRTIAQAAAIALAANLLAGVARADGDAALGQKVFKKCMACHTLEPAKKRQGPHLLGIVGRKAGSVAGYKYSKALQAADLVWSEDNLDKWLTKPRKFIPKTKMPFPGLRKKDDRDNVIAYLKSMTQ